VNERWQSAGMSSPRTLEHWPLCFPKNEGAARKPGRIVLLMRPGELLSRNLFPIEFSQNSPSYMGKREYFCTADGQFRDAETIYLTAGFERFPPWPSNAGMPVSVRVSGSARF